MKLPALDKLPHIMTQFLQNNDFLNNIRKYNAAFSFISFNANTDSNISSNNIYTLRVHGQIYHKIGPLLATDNMS